MRTDQPALYRIRVEGRLDPSWSDRMGGLAIAADEAETAPVTVLTGELADQSALHGVLRTLLELHLPILSTERLTDPGAMADAADGEGPWTEN